MQNKLQLVKSARFYGSWFKPEPEIPETENQTWLRPLDDRKVVKKNIKTN
jgi:hypothetical protein